MVTEMQGGACFPRLKETVAIIQAQAHRGWPVGLSWAGYPYLGRDAAPGMIQGPL
ncbi:MAG: hypothetical protein ACLT3C_04120 [Peptococcus niger]